MKAYIIPYLVIKDFTGNATFGASTKMAYNQSDAAGQVYTELQKLYPNGKIELSNAVEIPYDVIEYWAKEYGII